MDVNECDVNEYMESTILTGDVSVTAGGSGDATEVTPTDDIDMSAYESGFVLIHYKTTLGSSETLSFELQKEDSDTDGGSKSADVEVLAATVVKTGAATGYEATYQIPIPASSLKSWKRYVNLLLTPNLSASNTDTCRFSASFVGIKKNVS